MTRHPAAALLIALLLLALLLPASLVSAQNANAAASPDVAKIQHAIGGELSGIAVWCQRKDLDASAKKFATEALEYIPDDKNATKVLERLEGREAKDNEADAVQRSWQRKLESDGKKLAGLYCDLFDAMTAATKKLDTAPLHKAYGWNAETTLAFIDKQAAASKDKDAARAYALLGLGQELAPDDDRAALLRRVELKLAETTPIIRKASTHTMHYYLTLPKGWSEDKTWPIIVAVEGAGCGFAGCHGLYVRERKDQPFIIITPIGFSNTNSLTNSGPKYPQYPAELLTEIEARGQAHRLDWDEEGLLAVLADVRKEFKGRSKIFITGFSGGGMLTWTMVMRHPDMVAAAAPSCGNFTPSIDNGKLPTPPDPALPIIAFQGKDDGYLESILNPQWGPCEQCYKKMGFTNVERRMVPGGHNNFAGLIVPFFTEHLARSGE
ncbi:MAG: hypothetical protein AB7S36_10250 [Planctomycetota bacterium]